jgi:two-component system nitrate/nitrite response regulator NarL
MVHEHAIPTAEKLTRRQLQVLKLAATGKFSREIAKELGVSVSCVDFHLLKAYERLGARNKIEAIIKMRETFPEYPRMYGQP